MKETWIKNNNKKGITYTLKVHYGIKDNGAYNWKKFTAKTKSEARKMRESYELKYGYAGNSTIIKQTFADYLENWGEVFYKLSIKQQTYYAFLDAIKNRIRPYSIGSIQLAFINVESLQRYINELLEQGGYSLATIRKTWRYIKLCLNHAFDVGDLPEIRLSSVRLPKEENVHSKAKKVEAFSLTDIEKIVNESSRKTINGYRYYQFGDEIIFLMNTGLRISEATAITWSDIDFESRAANISRSSVYERTEDSIDGKKYHRSETSTKTLRSTRKVILNNSAIEALLRIREKNAGHCGENDFVFLSKTFNIPSRRNINRCLKEITTNAKCDLITGSVHVLRHTYASMFLSKKIPISFISKQLGHAKESTTRDIYASYMPEDYNKDKENFIKF